MIGIQYLADSISVPGYPQSCPKEELQGKMQPKQQEPWPLDESGEQPKHFNIYAAYPCRKTPEPPWP